MHDSHQDREFPARQLAIQGRCFHPSGRFIPFTKDALEQSIPGRFEQLVTAGADRLAVRTAEHELTYAALNAAANRIAHALLEQRGEQPEPVGLLLEPGALAVAAILGVLKAGKFYVPLEPAYPRTRITYILADAQTCVLLTNTRHLALACELAGNRCHVLNLDELSSSLAQSNPARPIAPDALAYILYTSGSTGQPKGVVENHRNVLHEVMRITNVLHICAEDRQTLLRSVGFSGAVRDIFGSLLNGAALFPFALGLEGIDRLAAWLIQERITLYRSVTTVFRQFVQSLSGTERFPDLRVVHIGGEPVSAHDVSLYQAHFPATCMLVNGLGITEGGSVRMYLIDHETAVTSSIVPVGYAVEDMRVLLLDEHGQEVLGGEIGEIAVHSRYLALGYWQRPELSHTAFLPDPSGGPARIYRTGDVGRLLPDGSLLHLGRQDFQVKVRGHRIEVAEIEQALVELDCVREAVVVAYQDHPGEPRLIAYIVPAASTPPTTSTLRQQLLSRLPAAMLPARYMFLDALPLTPTSKVDRRSLPAPDALRPTLDVPWVAPCSPIETALVAMWAETLGLSQVGIHDPFLELGGDSLLATRLIARVQATWQVEVSVAELLEAPTVAQMAVVIALARMAQASPDASELFLADIENLQDAPPRTFLDER